MSYIAVPHARLSQDALNALIDEFVTRDSGVFDGSLNEKRTRVLQQLSKNHAIITFDTETGTSHILTQDEFERLAHDD